MVKLTQKIADLCSKARTLERCGLSRAPVLSLFPVPQLSSRGRRLRAMFHERDHAHSTSLCVPRTSQGAFPCRAANVPCRLVDQG